MKSRVGKLYIFENKMASWCSTPYKAWGILQENGSAKNLSNDKGLMMIGLNAWRYDTDPLFDYYEDDFCVVVRKK